MNTAVLSLSEVFKTRLAANRHLELLQYRPDYDDLRVMLADGQPGFVIRFKAKAEKPGRAMALETAKAPTKSTTPAPRAFRFQEELDAAKKGKMPKAPDFSAPSRERYRGKLAAITKLVRAKDVAGLVALQINPVDSSGKIMARYRDHAVIAIQAKG